MVDALDAVWGYVKGSTVLGQIDNMASNVSDLTMEWGHNPLFWTEESGNFLHTYDTIDDKGRVVTNTYELDESNIDRVRHFYGIRLSRDSFGDKWTNRAALLHELTGSGILSGADYFKGANYRAYNTEATKADHKNNTLAFQTQWSENDKIVRKIYHEGYEPTDEELLSVVGFALANTVVHPKYEDYGIFKRKLTAEERREKDIQDAEYKRVVNGG